MKRLLIYLFLLQSLLAQNPHHVLTGHPRININSTTPYGWNGAKSSLQAISDLAAGGDATAAANWATLRGYATTGGTPNFQNGSNGPNLQSLKWYAFTYAVYHFQGNDSAANPYALAAWNGMKALTGSAMPITQIVVSGGTATATVASTTGVSNVVSAIWGAPSAVDALNYTQSITVTSGTTFTYPTSAANGTYTSSTLVLSYPTGGSGGYWGGADQHGYVGTTLAQWALLYDYCYPWLVANGHDVEAQAQVKAGYGDVTPTRVSSQWGYQVRESDFHNYSSWGFLGEMLAGLALQGDDAGGEVILDEAADIFWRGVNVHPNSNDVAETFEFNIKKSTDVLTGGAFNEEGTGYWRNGAVQFLQGIEAYDSATNRYSDIWNTQFSTAANAAWWHIYMTTPNYAAASFGDGGVTAGWAGRDGFGVAVINYAFPNSHFMWFIDTVVHDWNAGGIGQDGLVEKLLFYPYAGGPGSHDPSDLPLARQFGPQWSTRDSWAFGGSACFTAYNGGISSVYHQHEDAGTWTMQCGADLIALAQPYTLTDPVYESYNRRTVGANSLLVRSTSDCIINDTASCGVFHNGDDGVDYTYANSGDQIYKLRRFTPQFATGLNNPLRLWSGSVYTDSNAAVFLENSPLAGTLFSVGSGYEHSRQDLSKFYSNSYSGSGNNPQAKTSNVMRETAHFQPTLGTVAPLVIFDRVTATSSSYLKSWLMQVSGAPTVDGVTSTPGDTSRTSASVTRVSAGSSRGWVSHLLPAAPTVRTVGGNACAPVTIVSGTQANPAVLYAPGHGLTAGEAIDIRTGLAEGGNPTDVYSAWYLDRGGSPWFVNTVVDADHFTLRNQAGAVLDTSSGFLPWTTAHSSGTGAPSGSGSCDPGNGYACQIYYQTDAASGNTVWVWWGGGHMIWVHLLNGVGYTAPIIYSHTACQYAYYVDQIAASGSPAGSLWNSSMETGSVSPIWRIEEKPASANLTDYFLNVISPTASGVGSAPATSLLSASGWYGAMVTDSGGYYVAMFPTSSTLQTSAAYSVTHSGSAIHVVKGLAAGTVTVKQGASVIATPTVDAAGGISFTETGGGSFTVFPPTAGARTAGSMRLSGASIH